MRVFECLPTRVYKRIRVSGLYAENHGFVQNMMYDSHFGDFFLMGPNDTASVPHWWESAEPLWITAEKKGLRSALYWWDGCQVIPFWKLLPFK
ncbi:hypothetical protein CEXT_94771 [Caerostris extrusa]|uniref:Ectonucleotide pyrophosphatase/phosphodiesterase family member 6 n=1 Tax=Caerostris extrusa TaxID=172846 RepID=A0AAV4SFX5_CAEEX|nr:hypothetical protein CEXT_94771 [Caerostris extrusa]